MLYSMTGFGNARIENEIGQVYVEIKTLNSKYLDFNIRLNSAFSSKEIELRQYLEKILKRGKVNVTINFKSNKNKKLEIEKDNFKSYYMELINMAHELNAHEKDIFKIVAQLPDMFNSDFREVDSQEWNFIIEAVQIATQHCNTFRKNEGLILTKAFQVYVSNIQDAVVQITPFEEERVLKIKERINVNLQKINTKTDQNRIEQELVLYSEKLDITEEKIRIQKHIDFFSKSLLSEESNGKKLEFILQEINREANTISAKANHFEIQRLVVDIKENIGKIKEQLMNIL